MKKNILILILFLCAIGSKAQYLKAIVFLENGTQKEGLAEMAFSNNAKVNFRKDENSSKEKIATLDIKQIIYTHKDQTTSTMEPLYRMEQSIFNDKFSISKKKYWFTIVYDKEQKIGRTDDKGDSRPNNYRGKSSSFYFGKKASTALVFGYISPGYFIKTLNTDTTLKKMSAETFADCPAIKEAVQKEYFENKTALKQIIDIFDKTTCK